MSDMRAPVSALGGAVSKGFADVREIGPLGMITLRAKPDAKGLAKFQLFQLHKSLGITVLVFLAPKVSHGSDRC